MIGDGQGIHPQLLGAGHQAGNAADAVQHAVLSVNVKVREHYTPLPAPGLRQYGPHRAKGR